MVALSSTRFSRQPEALAGAEVSRCISSIEAFSGLYSDLERIRVTFNEAGVKELREDGRTTKITFELAKMGPILLDFQGQDVSPKTLLSLHLSFKAAGHDALFCALGKDSLKGLDEMKLEQPIGVFPTSQEALRFSLRGFYVENSYRGSEIHKALSSRVADQLAQEEQIQHNFGELRVPFQYQRDQGATLERRAYPGNAIAIYEVDADFSDPRVSAGKLISALREASQTAHALIVQFKGRPALAPEMKLALSELRKELELKGKEFLVKDVPGFFG